MKIKSDKEMIECFKYLIEDWKICMINKVFHFMDIEASTALKITIITMDIKYQLVNPNYWR